MVELQGLDNPSGRIPTGRVTDVQVITLILNHALSDGIKMFLSVTKKWNSSAWQASYILQYGGSAREFAQCPLVYLAKTSTNRQKVELFKYFTQGAVDKAKLSE